MSSWLLNFHPAVRKDLRRLPKEARVFILNMVLPQIAADPYAGEQLHGPLKGFWKYRHGEHRIAYSCDEKRGEVVILETGKRGGFYERLKQRLGK
ncbi:MAG: type II toxin-antitoxin system RelE/ParE family toxin [Patescibacteria group bacterium]